MKCDTFQSVTVEPVLFLFIFAGGLTWPTIRAVVYRKVCLSNYNASLCDEVDNGNHTMEENNVQSEASHWFLAEVLCVDTLSIMLSFFYGALSDKVSRKVAILLPVVGQFIKSIFFLIYVIFVDLPVGVILLGPLTSGLFGGWVVCCMACFSLLGDITTPDNRTTRMAAAESMMSASHALALFTGGVLLDNTSFVCVLAIAHIIYAVTIIYVLFGIKHVDQSANHVETKNIKEMFSLLCSVSSVKSTTTVVLRRRPHGKRRYLLVVLVVVSLIQLANNARWSLGYLYVKHYPLNWSQSTYGYFVGFESALRGLCLIILIPVFKNVLRMRDTTILFLGLLSSISSEVLFGVTTITWVIFLSTVTACLSDATFTCTRSVAAAQVEHQELGQMFAVFGSLHTVTGLVSHTLYNTLYPLTLDTWRGICFVAGAALSVIPFSLIGWLHYNLKSREDYECLDDDDDDGESKRNGLLTAEDKHSSNDRTIAEQELHNITMLSDSSDD